jgi:DNA-binding SARP family transcriptional activator
VAGLNPSANITLDVALFRELLTTAETHDHSGTDVCPDCLTPLEEAVELYRDDFMAGFMLRDSPAFDEWQFFQSQGLREALASALERLAHVFSAHNEHERAIGYARRWVAQDPLHEPAQRLLIQLYGLSGQRAAALRQYEECVRILEEELGAPPEEQTRALYETLSVSETLSLFFAPFKLNRERDIYRVTKQGLLKVDG